MMKKFTFFFLFFIILAVAVIGGSPYWTLYQLKNAYDNHQSNFIIQHIAFPQLKQNLKSQLTPILTQKAKNFTDLPLVKTFAPNFDTNTMIEQIVNHSVDNAITPNNIQQLLNNTTNIDKNTQILGGLIAVSLDKINIQELITARNPTELQQTLVKQLNTPNKNTTHSEPKANYCGFYCFEIQTNVHGYPITVEMKRQNLINWQIVAVKFPFK